MRSSTGRRDRAFRAFFSSTARYRSRRPLPARAADDSLCVSDRRHPCRGEGPARVRSALCRPTRWGSPGASPAARAAARTSARSQLPAQFGSDSSLNGGPITATCDVLAVALRICIGIMHPSNGCRIHRGIRGMAVIRSALTNADRSIRLELAFARVFDNLALTAWATRCGGRIVGHATYPATPSRPSSGVQHQQ